MSKEAANDNPDLMSFDDFPTVIPPVPTSAAEALEVCERLEQDGFESPGGPLRNAMDWINIKAFIARLR